MEADTIGRRIAKLRNSKGLDAKAFAEKIGTTGANIANIESGVTKSPGFELVANIVKAFNLSDSDAFILLFGKQPDFNSNEKLEYENANLRTENERLREQNYMLTEIAYSRDQKAQGRTELRVRPKEVNKHPP